MTIKGTDSRTIAAHVHAASSILVLLLVERFGRKEDGAIQRVWETAVATSDLHGDDDEFGQRFQLTRERGVDAWVAETETDGSVGGDDLEEHGEEGEGVVVCVLEPAAFDDGNEEEAQKDEPQIEGELASQMVAEVARLCFVIFISPDAEGLLFVDVGLAHGHGNWKDGDIHHDQVAHLNGGVEVGNIDDGKPGSTCCGGLKEAVEEAESGWKNCNGRIIELDRISQDQ